MELCIKELREYIIRPTLVYLQRHSIAAENLLVALAEIHRQKGNHEKYPGIFAIDAALHQRVWNQHLAFDPDLASKIRGLASQREFLNNPHIELTTNLSYATAIAWTVYLAYPDCRHAHATSAATAV